MSLDLSQDWQVVDDLQPVTYFVKVNEGVYASGFTVSGTYWEEQNQFDYMQNPMLLQQQTRAVHLWQYWLSGFQVSGNVVPKMDDRVTDLSGTNWYATKVELLDLDSNGVQRYRLTCSQGT